MDNNAFSFYSNVFGLFIGATTILGVLLGFCRSHLPSQKIKELEDLLDETQTLYKSAVEDGLLPDGVLRSQMGERLAVLREKMLMLRPRAYNATNLLKEYHEFFRGLSYSIGVACGNVKELRASVITTTEAERRRTGVSAVQQPSSPALPRVACEMEITPVPRPQSDSPGHSCGGHIIAHVATPHAPRGLHDTEVDLTELIDPTPATLPGRRFSLDTASTFSDDRSYENRTTEFKLLPRAEENASPLLCHSYPEQQAVDTEREQRAHVQ